MHDGPLFQCTVEQMSYQINLTIFNNDITDSNLSKINQPLIKKKKFLTIVKIIIMC